MRRRLRLPVLLAAAAAAAVACAPAARTAAPPGGVEPRRAPETARESREATRRAIVRAKLRFDSLARAGDAAGMAGLFAEDAVVITPARDTLRGREAIARRLGAALPAAGAVRRASFNPARVEPCLDGMYEFGGTYNLQLPDEAPGRPRLVSGPYAARWSGDSARGVRVAMAVFAAPETERRPARAGCRLPYVSTFARQRLWLVAVPAQVSSWTTTDRVTSGLRDAGWGDGRITHREKPACCYGSRDPRGVGTAVGVRYLRSTALGAELVATVLPERSVVEAFRPQAESHLSVTTSVFPVAALLSAGTRFVRVAAGPALLAGSATVRDLGLRRVLNAEPNPDSTVNHYELTGEPTQTRRWAMWRPGAAAQLSAIVPLSGRAFGELRAQWSRYGGSDIPRTLRFPGTRTSAEQSVGVGLAIGIAI